MNSDSKILFVGWGRAGKDAGAEYLGTITALRYAGSTSWAAKELVAKVLNIHPMVAWETRHQRRLEWKSICDALRQTDQTLLIRKALETGDIVAGVRDGKELDAARAQGIFDRIIWVSRPGIPHDPTVTFTATRCDETIINDGTLEQYHAKLRAWADVNGLLPKPFVSPTTDVIRE